MRTFEILIEQNALGAVRPMAVAAHAPVSALVPAIVDELKLPQTDLFGNRLVYLLRCAEDGSILSDDKSLAAAGINSGAKLALDSYVMDGSVATLMHKSQQSRQPSFYTSETMADSSLFPALGVQTSGSLPRVYQRKKGQWSRRAFLLLGGAVLGVGTAGLGYAAYHSFLSGATTGGMTTRLAQNITPAQSKPTTAPLTIPTGARAGLVFMQHQQIVRSVTWSPDGKMLGSGANDKQLLTWDVNGTVQLRLQQPASVHVVAWSPDGMLLAAGAANQITWLNAQTGAVLGQSTQDHTKTVTTLAWSQQQPARLVSGSADMHAIVWDAATFTPQTVFTRHSTPIEAASWASDNSTVATSSQGGAVRVWNASTGQEVHNFFLDAQLPMRALAFAPTGSQLAVGGDDGIVRIWNGLTCQVASNGQCMDMPMQMHGHTKIVRALAWSPDGRFLATAGDDGVLAIWYPAQSQTPLFKVNQDDPVLALAWSPGGKQIATASGNSVTIWGLQ